MNWASLYMQRPAPETGDYFRVEWLKPYEKIPPIDTLRCYGGSDFAITSKGGDYTVHLAIGVDPDDRMYVLDCYRAQASPDVWIERLLDMWGMFKPISWAFEKSHITTSVGPFLERRMGERKVYCGIETFPTRGDKAVRAQSIRGKMARDGLWVAKAASWCRRASTKSCSNSRSAATMMSPIA